MSDQDTWHREREVTLVISDVVVKGYHECLFSVDIGDKFVARKKRGDRGNAFKVTDHRGQLGHLQRDLVAPLWRLQKQISRCDIYNLGYRMVS